MQLLSIVVTRGPALLALLALLAALPGLALPGPALPGQSAPGFSSSTVWSERAQPFSVRGFALDPVRDELLVAIGGTVFREDAAGTRLTVFTFPGDDVAALVHEPGAAVARFTAVRAGTLVTHDLITGSTTASPGVANTFDLTVVPGGAVLASANPAWPAPGADSGVWLLGAGAPREVIRMRGPSGPLLALADGSLLVADFGAAFPPPRGAVSILRFDAALVAASLAGGPSLSHRNGSVELTGLDGAYDLALDNLGNLYLTDPQSAFVQRAALGSGALDPVPLTAVNGGALQMELAPGTAPMLPWQPGDRAESLLLASSDFASEYRLQRIAPERPELVAPAGPTGAGPLTLGLRGAPASGIAVLAFQLSPLVPERVVVTVQGAPVWLALDGDPLAPIVTTTLRLDPTGAGSLTLRHPGGFGFRVHLQALALRVTGGFALGTTAAATLDLLP